MAKLKLDPHLTQGHSQDLSGQIAATYAGMAHFARSGPDGRECRECIHWMFQNGDYYQSGTGRKNTLKPQACGKGSGGKVPYYAAACKYFDEIPTPPPISAPRKP